MVSLFKNILEVCDVVSCLFFCPEDGSIALCSDSTNELLIPSAKVPLDTSYNATVKKLSRECFDIENMPFRLLRIARVWLPSPTRNEVHHVIFDAKITPDLRKKTKSFKRYRGKLRWVQETESLSLNMQNILKSPEILDCCQRVCRTSRKSSLDHGYTEMESKIPEEYFSMSAMIELGESIVGQTSMSQSLTKILESAGFNAQVVMKLYREFVVYTFPYVFMSLYTFVQFAAELGWQKDEAQQLHRAADSSMRRGLSFYEFLGLIASIEPQTNINSNLRNEIIFRFFDRDRDNQLNLTEFRNMINSAKRARTTTDTTIDADALFRYIGKASSTNISLNEFLQVSAEPKLKILQAICRSNFSVYAHLQDAEDKLRENENTKSSDLKSKKDTISKAPDFGIALHTIKLQEMGTLIAVEQLTAMEGALQVDSKYLSGSDTLQRKQSIATFSPKSVANEVLRGLRYLTQINMKKSKNTGRKDIFTWGALDSKVFGKNLVTICLQAKECFKSEPRMVEMKSPVYILGDLHGNMSELLCFEKAFWHLGPVLSPVSLLFLGDFVDRGLYGMEVVAYLFAYKVQSPNKLVLIRGNHEIKQIQLMFSFQNECVSKFGDLVGKEVWEAVNCAFDCLPLAALVDKKVFCCHGGIPPPWLCPTISAINSIPSVLHDPEEQSPLAWELMWNDPAGVANRSDSTTYEMNTNEGFASNRRRGTAHVFNAEALEKFLLVNNLAFVVRAHEMAQYGFDIHHNAKMVTVFSTSKYCNSNNEAACICIEQNKLRILRTESF